MGFLESLNNVIQCIAGAKSRLKPKGVEGRLQVDSKLEAKSKSKFKVCALSVLLLFVSTRMPLALVFLFTFSASSVVQPGFAPALVVTDLIKFCTEYEERDEVIFVSELIINVA